MTSKSKNVNTDKLADIVNEYNNSYHRIFKMKLVDLKSSTHTDFDLEIKIKTLNLKLVTKSEYQSTKTFLQKVTLQIGVKKLKIQSHGHM